MSKLTVTMILTGVLSFGMLGCEEQTEDQIEQAGEAIEGDIAEGVQETEEGIEAAGERVEAAGEGAEEEIDQEIAAEQREEAIEEGEAEY